MTLWRDASDRRHLVVCHEGLMVYPTNVGGRAIRYAEVTLAYSRWLPWPGRTSRWRYEIYEVIEPDEQGRDVSALAYVAGGSGGGFTLASCIRRAHRAIDTLPVAGGSA